MDSTWREDLSDKSHLHIAIFVISPSLLVEQVEDHHNLTFADTRSLLIEPIESWIDHVNKLICGFPMLEATSNSILVHSVDKIFEFIANEQAIAISVARLESFLDLRHEGHQLLRVLLQLHLELGPGRLFLLGELGLPVGLILQEWLQEGHDSRMLLSGDLLDRGNWWTAFNHTSIICFFS